jgi:hypothetical protein
MVLMTVGVKDFEDAAYWSRVKQLYILLPSPPGLPEIDLNGPPYRVPLLCGVGEIIKRLERPSISGPTSLWGRSNYTTHNTDDDDKQYPTRHDDDKQYPTISNDAMP